MCSLGLELSSVALMRLLLAVFESGALVILEEAVLSAKVAGAETAVTDDALGCVTALLEVAADLLLRHVERRWM